MLKRCLPSDSYYGDSNELSTFIHFDERKHLEANLRRVFHDKSCLKSSTLWISFDLTSSCRIRSISNHYN